MKIGVIGTGAVGGYYGALLVKSGFDVHFLLRTDFLHVCEHGLVVESVNGNFILDKVNAYAVPEDMPVCDVIIVALKTTQNNHLASILPKITCKDSIVVLLQNGLGGEEEVSGIVPSAAIIGGLCFICSHKLNPGHIRHQEYGSIRFGQYQKGEPAGAESRQLKTVVDIFVKAGVTVHLAENLGKARWEKLVWNVGFNGLTVILNATTDLIVKNQSSRRLVRELMLEVIAGARACGYDIADKFADIVLDATDRMSAYSPSMKLDFEAGRSLEIDSIYWRPIIAAEKYGCDMPKTKVVALQLDFLNRLKK